MLKRMEKNVEQYMRNTTSLSYSSSVWQEQCYTFGYLDGYFQEKIYIEYICNSDNNEKKLKFYNEGFEEGTKYGKRTRMYEPEVFKQELSNWVKVLAIHDALNEVKRRNFKEDTMLLYEKYQNQPYSLGKLDFIDEKGMNAKKR